MCGNHSADGSPIDHEHGPGSVVWPGRSTRSRRAFLGDLGKGTLAMAIVSPAVLIGCSSSAPEAVASVASMTTPAPDPTAAPDATAPAPAEIEPTAGPEPTEETVDELRWARTNLGFVSAYVLARGNQAAIVDTGVAGSATAIGETLVTLGLNYSDVGHVLLTHNHGDHAGSIAEVAAQAINARVYAGEADLTGLSHEGIVGLSGGEDVFGFEMLATPGHTAGHMCAIDHAAGLLVAGDAIFGEAGGVVEGPERFFADVSQSRESIKSLATMSFNTLVFGHGDPIEDRADLAVAALAASLG